VPDERSTSEAHATSMALVDEPPPTPGIVARRVADFDEFVAAGKIADAAFGASEAEAQAYAEIAEASFARERAGVAARTYIALIDGEAVGVGRAIIAGDCPAAVMIGGAVLPKSRGRGVYRALVRARWEDAAAAGLPALVTHAGAMSRPILERLGFQAVAEQEILLDPATA
jgi:GNAT superfamily N-acetyltransferase